MGSAVGVLRGSHRKRGAKEVVWSSVAYGLLGCSSSLVLSGLLL